MVRRRIRENPIRLIYRTGAVRDLREIARSTKQRWGHEQATVYGDGLRRDIKSLLEFPLRYPALGASTGGLRKMGSGHHLVFYIARDNEIEVVRVLHERMDYKSSL